MENKENFDHGQSVCAFSNSVCPLYDPNMIPRLRFQEAVQGEILAQYVARFDTLYILLEGSLELTFNDKSFLLNQGEMITLSLFTVISGKALTPIKAILLNLMPGDANPCISRVFTEKYIDFAQQPSKLSDPLKITPLLMSYFNILLFQYEHNPHCRIFHTQKIQELSGLLIYEYTYEELGNFLFPLFRKENDFLRKFNKYLNYFNTVDEIAEKMGMTSKTFTRLFKKIFHKAPYQWLKSQKAYAILQYISTTNCSIKDVMEHFNFSSYNRFNLFCIAQYHCSSAELFKKLKR